MVQEKEIVDVIRKVSSATKPFQLPITTKIGQSHDPFRVLISTALSPQTRDTVTGPAFTRLMGLASSPRALLALPEKKIQKAIYPVSFYRIKAKNVRRICKILLEKHKGKVPSSMPELLALPGVGRKIAGLVMIYGFGKTESIPVDTHCHRIPQRLGWLHSRSPVETEKKLMELVPRKYWKEFNNTFVKFGQNICLPLGPKCGGCPVSKQCKYYREVYLNKNRAKSELSLKKK